MENEEAEQETHNGLYKHGRQQTDIRFVLSKRLFEMISKTYSNVVFQVVLWEVSEPDPSVGGSKENFADFNCGREYTITM